MKSILFKPSLAEQIRKGNKTQTRRVIKEQDLIEECPDGKFNYFHSKDCGGFCDYGCNGEKGFEPKHFGKYQIGGTIYVKESFKLVDNEMYLNLCGCSITPCDCPEVGQILYRKENYGKYDTPEERGFKWTSALFMPEKYARTFLKVTNVRVERLKDISDSDALAEGVEELKFEQYKNYKDETGKEFFFCPKRSFASLWESINGKDESKNWAANPWVFVYEFETTNFLK